MDWIGVLLLIFLWFYCVSHWKHGFSGKFVGINYALLPNRQWNKKQKHKKQPWSNVECFAFGVRIVRFASLKTSFHAANHTIPPPPSHEGSPHCPKDKNRSPFHGEKPLMIKYYYGKGDILCLLIIVIRCWKLIVCGGREVSRPYHAKSFGEIWCGFLPRNHFIVKGFSPWNGERFLSLGQCGEPS